MIIVCPRCGILYGVDPDELDVQSRAVRCSNCDREWLHTPAAALPDNDEALRLLAASFGRDGPRPPPARPSTTAPQAELASAKRSARRETPAAQAARPRPVAVEPEAALRPAAVTALFPVAPTTGIPSEEALSRGGRLSSRQLDALLNGADANNADTGPGTLKAGPVAAEEDAWGADAARSSKAVRELPKAEAAPAIEPARALNAVPEDDTVGVPPPPDESGGEEAASAPPRAPLLGRHRTVVLAAGAVAATLLVSVGLLAASRGLVMAAFPGAAGFYSAVGLAPADTFASGLEIRDVSSTRSWSDGEQILTVAGDLANVARQPRSLPMVRVVLVDGSDAEVQEVVVLPPGETLPVGESIRFEARISNPADTAERIKVSLAPRPEPS
ncbi:MAG TPA: zinc-ribbon domain-containing protein [Rhodospirillales bacterium]|nr:zinc-ribbon domain-containing protein [Rhodospirillales bacterium]